MKATGAEWYVFVPIVNQHTGTHHAPHSIQFGGDGLDLACGMMAFDGYGIFASFHTHPPGFGPYPSRVDLHTMFPSYPTNFIFSPEIYSLFRYDHNKKTNSWNQQKIKLQP